MGTFTFTDLGGGVLKIVNPPLITKILSASGEVIYETPPPKPAPVVKKQAIPKKGR